MKKLSHIFFAVLLIAANILVAIPSNTFASANDFYFKDYTADFYLKKAEDNTSELQVTETVTAVFPNYNQNHGIERYIPFLNQNDTNLTMESAEYLNITVTRNGNDEPYRVIPYDDHFLVRIGDADTYVHGENTYVMTYKFIHTITEFDSSRYFTEAYQELYWNANGTESSQTFESVTVNLHMADEVKRSILKDKTLSKSPSYMRKDLISETNTTKEKLAAWCYVGYRGSSNQNRCSITDIDDGIRFSTGKLNSHENLTFVVSFKDKTFVVPENDFVMKQFVEKIEGDYHLTTDSEGKAVLKAKENVVAVFPTKNISSGFYRRIPFVNSSGVVFTTDSQEDMEIKTTMDGKTPEESHVYPHDEGSFNISISSNERYLHGKHTFTYEYELKNLVVEKDGVEKFIYRPFNYLGDDVNDYKITLHIDDKLLENVTLTSYEGTNEKFGAVCVDNTKDIKNRRCTAEKTDDGFVFYASDVSSNGKFELEVNFKNGTFNIPDPNRNYICWHIFGIVAAFCTVFILFVCHRTKRRVGEKIKHLKNLPIIPEYTPHKEYTAGELAKNYLGKIKNPKVATLLELIVNKKVSLRKEKKSKRSKKYKWFITLIDKSDLSSEQKDLLEIINNGDHLPVDKEVEIKHHGYSSRLEKAFNRYDSGIRISLKNKGLRETNSYIANNGKPPKKVVGGLLEALKVFGGIAAFFAACYFGIGIIGMLIVGYLRNTHFTEYSIYEGKFLIPFIILMLFATFLFWPVISVITQKYHEHTLKGLEISRYMDGLKLYIKMAEAERIKFLQSVENVDTTDEGIVKLHEKLLPYAALFGLEKNWMKELEKYYELEKIETPDWYNTGLNYSTFAAVNAIMHSATSRPIDMSSSSSGWSGGGGFSSSSGSSGSGGGGFSGGGGGGGGFGGW